MKAVFLEPHEDIEYKEVIQRSRFFGVVRCVRNAADADIEREDVAGERLTFRTYTASGKLYDGFELVRGADGLNRLNDLNEPMIEERTCNGDVGPDGGKCVARKK